MVIGSQYPPLTIILKTFKTNPCLRDIYLIHVLPVTQLALRIAIGINLEMKQIALVKKAALLHDIGLPFVKNPKIPCLKGKYPYSWHNLIGYTILKKAKLHKEAEIALQHGLGYYHPLKPKTFIYPKSIEAEIVSYADLFFSKRADKLYKQNKPEEIIDSIKNKWAPNNPKPHLKLFLKWHKKWKRFLQPINYFKECLEPCV